MTKESQNILLYLKMSAEQDAYRDWLVSLQTHEMLEHCYEFAVREDILFSMESNDLTERQAKALLKSATPLADVFRKFEKWETGHMQNIWDCVVARANEVIRAEFIAKKQAERNQ